MELLYTSGMNEQLRKTVTAIALSTRKWAERIDRERYSTCWDLSGYCAIASAELHKRLKRAKIKNQIGVWENEHSECHCFCIVDDHVVDVTATQFRPFWNKPVVIMHTKEAEAHEMYNAVFLFHSATELRNHQKRVGWASDQIAFR